MFQLPHSNLLTPSDIGHLNRIFDNTSECYKLFWFQAILTKVRENGNAEKLEITFEDLIDEMIADSWYMVSEYHLNLGPMWLMMNSGICILPLRVSTAVRAITCLTGKSILLS